MITTTLVVSQDNIYDKLMNLFGMKTELINSVLDGDSDQGGVMPALKSTLSKADVNDIFEYIKSINGRVMK
ncbi:c-type cytochrome [Photobacterium marinum]|nr:cytochrome c [Photobacterium marinum]